MIPMSTTPVGLVEVGGSEQEAFVNFVATLGTLSPDFRWAQAIAWEAGDTSAVFGAANWVQLEMVFFIKGTTMPSFIRGAKPEEAEGHVIGSFRGLVAPAGNTLVIAELQTVRSHRAVRPSQDRIMHLMMERVISVCESDPPFADTELAMPIMILTPLEWPGQIATSQNVTDWQNFLAAFDVYPHGEPPCWLQRVLGGAGGSVETAEPSPTPHMQG